MKVSFVVHRDEKVAENSTFQERKPEMLHVPQFTYSATPTIPSNVSLEHDESSSDRFAFSGLFQSSAASPGFSVIQPTPSKSNKSILRERAASSFIGFTWGPSIDAFTEVLSPSTQKLAATPRVLQSTRKFSEQATPQRYPFATPVRPSAMTPFHTLPGTGTIRRTAPRRAVSDREAMKQLVNCVGMSARKKVLESGRKPRILASAGRSRSSTLKELRFDRSVTVFNGDSAGVSYHMDPTATTTSESAGGASFSLLSASTLSGTIPARDPNRQTTPPSESDSSMDSGLMYSPSPSPRPVSALSMALSKGSQTPTASGSIGSYVLKLGHNSMPSVDNRGLLSPSMPFDPQWQDTQADPPMLTDGILGRSLSNVDPFDELERRHETLLKDIAGLSKRLNALSLRVDRTQN